MAKNLKRGGSASSAMHTGPSSGRAKKNVSFKEEATIFELPQDVPVSSPANQNEKPKKGKYDIGELDKVLDRINQKFASKNVVAEKEVKNEKPKKGKYEISELDKGLERINQKFAGKNAVGEKEGTNEKPVKGKPDSNDTQKGSEKLQGSVASSGGHHGPSTSRQYSHQPWEIDPTSLRVEKVIGHGTFGRVYKGTYEGEQVAIKMLEWGDPTSDGDDRNEIAYQYRFFQEVQLMYKLEPHPNICRMIGASMGSTNFHVPSPQGKHQIHVSKSMCCIVMEYLDGGNLREFWINHRKSGKRRMPFNVMLQFAIDIAQGLVALHAKKICHRDLKPDNILMTHDCTLKIADFGLSRIWPEQGEHPMSLYKGTPAYSAPEILDGKQYSYKCDVYSYAICIWELYTCDVPFPEVMLMNRDPMNQRIINKNYRPPIPCCCPAVFTRIMTRCWDKDPAKRPDMVEVLKWLSEAKAGRAGLLTNDTVVECSACLVESMCRAHL